MSNSMPREGSYVEFIVTVTGLPYDKERWLAIATEMETIAFALERIEDCHSEAAKYRSTCVAVRECVNLAEQINKQAGVIDGPR
jgi:hypothetical protein